LEDGTQSDGVRIAVIGDLHDHWNDHDLAHLNGSAYDLVVFVGDLGRGEAASRRISRSIARLEPPTLVMPGNADAPHAGRLSAEFSLQRGLGRLLPGRAGPATEAGRPAAPGGGVRLCGYSVHPLPVAGGDVGVVAGRPYSMGGPELSFGPEVHGSFGVGSLEDSARRLMELVDASGTDRILFVSHNGPRGLGTRATDPWGADFLPEPADWGDPDLEQAVAHARSRGKQVLAVVAGHMHLGLRGQDQEREWRRSVGRTLYVNPARVPRITRRAGTEVHHLVELRLGPDGVEAEERFFEAPEGREAPA